MVIEFVFLSVISWCVIKENYVVSACQKISLYWYFLTSRPLKLTKFLLSTFINIHRKWTLKNNTYFCDWGSHDSEDIDYGPLGCNTVVL